MNETRPQAPQISRAGVHRWTPGEVRAPDGWEQFQIPRIPVVYYKEPCQHAEKTFVSRVLKSSRSMGHAEEKHVYAAEMGRSLKGLFQKQSLDERRQSQSHLLGRVRYSRAGERMNGA